MRDQPDDLAGSQIKVIWAVSPGTTTTQAEVDAGDFMRTSLQALNGWLASETGFYTGSTCDPAQQACRPGIQRRLRLDTYQGRIDVRLAPLSSSFANLAADPSALRTAIEADLRAGGHIDATHRYLVFADVRASDCHAAPEPSQLAAGERAGVYFTNGTEPSGSPCLARPRARSASSAPTPVDFTFLRTTFATLGAPVVSTADPCELMRSGAPFWAGCTGHIVIDPQGRHYYSQEGFTGEPVRANLYQSPFLTPRPGS